MGYRKLYSGRLQISCQRPIAVLVALILLLSATPAMAAPVASKRAEAARIKKEIDRLDAKMDVAVEDYDQALQRLHELNLSVAKNQKRLHRLKSKIQSQQTFLSLRVESMYRTGPTNALDVLLGAASFQELVTTWDLLNEWNDQQARMVSNLRASEVEARKVEASLENVRARARRQFKVVSARKRVIESQIAKREQLLKGVEKEIAALQAAERAAEAERARRAAAASGDDWNWTTPLREPRGGVVSIAMRYLGRPYQWAASGPGSFDCSGFTMFVYAKIGVSLPHSSREQIHAGPRVSRSDLKPGDLVFFGSPIHHVGLYIGNGQMIDAPHTGDVVSINSIDRGNYAGACRP